MDADLEIGTELVAWLILLLIEYMEIPAEFLR
jgi:hypothetical protein